MPGENFYQKTTYFEVNVSYWEFEFLIRLHPPPKKKNKKDGGNINMAFLFWGLFFSNP